MRVVLDTNILVSVFIFESDIPKRAVVSALQNHTVLVSKETLAELVRVFDYPKFKARNKDLRTSFLSLYAEQALGIDVTHKTDAYRDPKDNKFLELALSGKADCILTGDKDLTVLHPFQGVDILSPADFLKKY